MKRIKLLFAALAAMVSLGVQAQLTDGTVYWIQDAGTGQFISQGANWGTQATVQEVGGLGWQAVYVSDGVYKLKNIMWNKGNNADLGLRTSDRFCDQAAGDITLIASGDGFKINTTDGGYLCNNGDTNGDGVKRLGSTTEEADATVWKFLTKSEYDAAIQAYKDGKAATYATNLGYSVSSVSDLEALITDANQFISKDYTSSITNPTLGSNWDGWAHAAASGSSRSEGAGVGSGCAEFWNGCGAANQTVSGLPNGLYKVEFVGTFRPKGSADSEKLSSNETSSPAFVYANDAKVEFLHWIDVPAKANGRGGVTVAKGYNNTMYTYVTDGTLKIGIVQGCWEDGNMWCPFGQFRLTYYTDQVEDADITALVAQIPAESTIPAAVYSNLTSLKNTLKSTKTIADFNALSEAVTAANALVAPYAALVAEVAKAKALGIETADADAYLVGVTTAAEATANTQALMVAEYNYVVANYTTAIDLGTWTTENAGDMKSQHWDGTGTTTYNEQKDGWNQATNWSTSYTQTITLPEGEYVFKVAGRHSQYSVLTLSVKEGETVIGTVNDFPTGDTGRGINKNGVTSFDPDDAAGFANGGAGRGWQWRYVPFTLTAETAVTISVVGNNPDAVQYQWLSFCNYTVQAKPSVAAARIAYEQAVANANTALANSTYANVDGTDRSNLVAAVAVTPTETIEWYDEHKAIVEGYTTAFTAGVGSWNSYVAKAPVAKAEADLISTTICEGLTTPNTAAEAAAAPGHIRELTAAYVSTNYTYPLTTVIGDFTSWTRTATYIDGDGEHEDEPQTNKNQHWSGAESVYFEQGTHGWGASNGFNCTYTKTATLPAGNYVVKVAARASGDVTGTLRTTAATLNTVAMPNFGAASKGIDTSGAANFGDGEFANGGVGFGWEWRFLPFTLGENGEVTITIEESTTVQYNWFSLADAVLLSDESKFIPATAEDYAALNDAITAGEAKTLGFDAGDYAPYNNIEAIALLAAAKAIDQDAENTQEDVQAATTALTGATWTANAEELNAVYDGTFAAAENDGAPAGWRMSNNTLGGALHSRAFVGDSRLSEFNGTNSGLFLRFDGTNSSRGSMYYYGDTENYTMPLKAGVTYYAKVDVAGWGSTGKPIRLNVAGPAGFSAKYVQVNTSFKADTETEKTPQQLLIVFEATVAGNYVISFQTPGSDSNTHNVIVSNIEVKRATAATMTITDAQYATFVAPFAVELPSGVTAQTVEGASGQELVLSDKMTTAPANTPVVLYSESEVNETFYGYPVVGTPEAGLLIGVYASQLAPVGTYVLQKNDDKVGFYVVADGKQPTVGANRAYLTVPSSVKADAFFFDDTATAIQSVFSGVAAGEIYDLSGRKLNKLQKGVNIVNGKKVMVK